MTIKTSLPAALATVLLFSACAGHLAHRADEAYDLMAYQRARRNFERLLHRKPFDRDLLIKCAESCRRQNDMAAAAAYYQRADSIMALMDEDAQRYGVALMTIGEEHLASEMFLRVLDGSPEDMATIDLYASCKGYRTFFKDSGHFIMNRLTLPGMSSVFSAVPMNDGLLVTGERSAPHANPWNGNSFLDLYHSKRKTMVTWQDAVPLEGEVNGPFHEGAAVLSPDGRTLYFTRSNYTKRKLGKDDGNTSHLKLFLATLDSATGKWTNIQEFEHNGEDFSVGHPALSADGRTLYFASDRPGGLGGTDIWRCQDLGTGWSEPRNLGRTVNTAGNELFPVINGSALYFSSTAHDNMGGLDIFETHEINGRWSDPRNLNYPVNTAFDDFGFVVDASANISGARDLSGYLSSNREGSDQVYSFWATAPLIFFEGKVVDVSGRSLPHIEATLTDLLTMEDFVLMADEDGRFFMPLDPDRDYRLRLEAPGHMLQTGSLSTKGLLRSDTLRSVFELKSLDPEQTFALENILFDYDKWDIRPDAALELDKLVALFKDNPGVTYEMGAHTDSRGGDTYNLVLSDARANSVVNYLIQRGVNPDNVVARGFGETEPLNHCRNGVACTEEQHQANRRVEFRVVGSRYAASDGQ